ncbi:unnamed protein product [Oppiella nova]|uniref:Amidase domain-containing protein n=1 Tax=Oppiella nova TaxID=334625 RepID=A0A7R9LU20_9ACAR|nr:unnamed protein product [Oppiella nova]CAG2166990.1 unnamed protein product [Oppiella nova]
MSFRDDGVLLFPDHPDSEVKLNATLFNFKNCVYTAVFNCLSMAVTQVPLGLNTRRLPLGVQVIAKGFNDHLTIAVAEELERHFGGWPHINAVIDERYELAVEEAKEVDKRVTHELQGNDPLNGVSIHSQPLLGIPFAGKDSIPIKGLFQTTGCPARKGIKATEDAIVVKHLRDAGAIPVCMTNVPELLMWWNAYNKLYGQTYNPYDKSVIPSGSSGGSASLVSSAGAPLGIGSDLAGSIRMPSFFCGLFGHCITHELIPKDNHWPPYNEETKKLLTYGPIVRYASDLKPMVKVFVGKNASQLKLDESIDLTQIKVYYMYEMDDPFITRVTPDVRKGITDCVHHMKSLGATVQEVNLDKLKHSWSIWTLTMKAMNDTPMTEEMTNRNGSINLFAELFKTLCGGSDHTLGALAYAVWGKLYTSEREIQEYLRIRDELKTELTQLLGNDGIFLFPSHPESCVKLNATLFNLHNISYTAVFNSLNKTITQVPIGLNSRGLPLGVQVIANAFNDHLTIAVAEELERRLLLEPAINLVKHIKTGRLKCEDLVKAYVDRIKTVQPHINAVIDERYELAVEEAKEVDKRVTHELQGNEPLNGVSIHSQPLLGIPFVGKDCIPIKGLLQTTGCPARKGIKATEDATVVKYLRDAGAIPLAVTNVPELLLSWNTYNKLYGQTYNPYDKSIIPAGSSGGCASLVSSAGAIMGIGSDIGGSIRIPSFFCGLFGHCITHELIPKDNHWPPFPEEMMKYYTYGPIVRFATDLKPMVKVFVGKNASQLKLDESIDLTQIKVYYMYEMDDPFITRVTPDVRKGITDCVEHMKSLGATVQEAIKNTPMTEDMTNRNGSKSLFIEFCKTLYGGSDHTITALVMAVAMRLSISEQESQEYLKIRDELKAELNELLGNDSILLFPTHPDNCVKLNATIINIKNTSYTMVFNMLDMTITQVPIGLNSRGLPLGVQVIANAFNDHLTIAVAEELERRFGGWVPATKVQYE